MMKHKYPLSLLCGLVLMVTTGQSFAQSNTTRETAQEILPGEQIITQFTPGSVQTLWYKIAATQGTWYEITPLSTRLSIYKNTSNVPCITYENPYQGKQFKAVETTFYYIKRWYSPGLGESIEWSVIEFADNRVCDNAETIQMGSVVNVPTGQFYRWYKTPQEEGKYYVVRTDRMFVSVLFSCEGTKITKENKVYQKTTNTDTYFKSEAALMGGSFTVKEFPVQSNNTKENAIQLFLGEPTEYSHLFGEALYYKVNLEAGKLYEVSVKNHTFFMDRSETSIFDADNNPVTDVNTASSNREESIWFTAPHTGEFYICRTKDTTSPSDLLFTIAVNEISDNRLCENAIPINVGDTMDFALNNHIRARWYEVAVEDGKYYEIGSVDADWCEIKVFEACGSDELASISESTNVVKRGSNTTWHIATLNDAGGRWFINEFSPEGLDCEHAIPITLEYPIPSVGRGVEFDFTPEGYDYSLVHTGNGVWYKISNLEPGVYELRLPMWENYDDDELYDLPFNISVFSDCNISTTTYVGSAGYMFDATSKLRFNAEANTTYYFLVSDEHYEEIIEPEWSVIYIESIPTDTEQINLTDTKLYPTPFEKEIVVEGAKDGWLQIFNVNSRCVHTQKLTQTKETVQPNIPAGIYCFRIEKENEIQSFVVVKR